MRLYPCCVMALVLELSALALGQTAPATAPVTPRGFDDARTFVYRPLDPEPLRLHVIMPEGWTAADRRPAFVFFFGGGWVRGSPERSIGWARAAAKWGMVGIAPDYRVKDRFGGSAADCAADGRLALRWVQDHAAELGIDPSRVVVGGSSAGGHVALWASVSAVPPGGKADESPRHPPAAVVLMSGLTDTTAGTYGRRAAESGFPGPSLSPQHHLDPKMPPMILFHGDADTVVEHRQSAELDRKLRDSGNVSRLVTVPGGSHAFSTDMPEWRDRAREMIRTFLKEQGLVE